MGGCVVSMSHSSEPGNPPLIDAIEVYAKSRSSVAFDDLSIRVFPIDLLDTKKRSLRPLLKALSLLDLSASVLAAAKNREKSDDSMTYSEEVSMRCTKVAKTTVSPNTLKSEQDKLLDDFDIVDQKLTKSTVDTEGNSDDEAEFISMGGGLGLHD